MTLYSEKVLISNGCISGLKPNLSKKILDGLYCKSVQKISYFQCLDGLDHYIKTGLKNLSRFFLNSVLIINIVVWPWQKKSGDFYHHHDGETSFLT